MADILKLVVVGDGGVGKTSLLLSFTTDTFPADYVPTVFENYTADIAVADTVRRVTLFDTAGQEEFDKLRPLAYPKTDVFLVCFCVASPASYNNVKEKWLPEVRAICPDTPIVVVGTQTDRRGKEGISRHHNTMPLSCNTAVSPSSPGPRLASFVPPELGARLAKEARAALYLECSALTRYISTHYTLDIYTLHTRYLHTIH